MKEVLIITEKGWGIRMLLKDFPIQKRGGRGIRAIQIQRGDKVVSVVIKKAKKA